MWWIALFIVAFLVSYASAMNPLLEPFLINVQHYSREALPASLI
jgi:hypothetical protein